MDTLNIRRRVVEYALGSKVVESGLFWLEFKADYTEWFAIDHSYWGVCSEGFGRILHDFIEDRSIAGVDYLDGLIHWFIDSCWSKDDLIGWTDLDHWDEGLGSRREGMTH